jgi:hypothetical protein
MTTPQSPPWLMRRGPKGLKRAILRSLADGAETSREVAADLGIDTRRASTYMFHLERRGVLTRKVGMFYPPGPSRGNPPMVRFVRARGSGLPSSTNPLRSR